MITLRTTRFLAVNLFAAGGLALVLISCGGGGSGGSEITTTTTESTTTTTVLITSQLGGTIATSDNRFSLAIPPGALAQDTSITVTPESGPATVGYALQPAGLNFITPAQVALTVNQSELGPITFPGGLSIDLNSVPIGYLLIQENQVSTKSVIDQTTIKTSGNGNLVITGNLNQLNKLELAAADAVPIIIAEYTTDQYTNIPFKVLLHVGTGQGVNTAEFAVTRSVLTDITSTVSGQTEQPSNMASTLDSLLGATGYEFNNDTLQYTFSSFSLDYICSVTAGTGQIGLSFTIKHEGTFTATAATSTFDQNFTVDLPINCADPNL
ncbi:MAG: hypothetical protein KJ950_13835 [Proteobacteria bacterium]|nr:hypothetical protein [Pseudomonadota bacterium]MBU1686090.1 hypothetical protein [Pseudomonadota bacterium]